MFRWAFKISFFSNTSPHPAFLRNKDVYDFNLLTVSGVPKGGVVTKWLVLFWAV